MRQKVDIWNLSNFFCDFLQKKKSKISNKKRTFEISATIVSDFLKNSWRSKKSDSRPDVELKNTVPGKGGDREAFENISSVFLTIFCLLESRIYL